MKNLFLTIGLFVALCFSASAQSNVPCTSTETNAQRAAFAPLSNTEKVALWKNHLKTQTENRKLNKDQRETIRQASLLLTAEFYAANGNFSKQDLANYAELQSKMRANFSAKEGKEIFESLGDSFKIDANAEKLSFTPDCNCSTTWTWCDTGICRTVPNSVCVYDNCTRVINCGIFWGFQCNGMCCGPSYESKPVSVLNSETNNAPFFIRETIFSLYFTG